MKNVSMYDDVMKNEEEDYVPVASRVTHIERRISSTNILSRTCVNETMLTTASTSSGSSSSAGVSMNKSNSSNPFSTLINNDDDTSLQCVLDVSAAAITTTCATTTNSSTTKRNNIDIHSRPPPLLKRGGTFKNASAPGMMDDIMDVACIVHDQLLAYNPNQKSNSTVKDMKNNEGSSSRSSSSSSSSSSSNSCSVTSCSSSSYYATYEKKKVGFSFDLDTDDMNLPSMIMPARPLSWRSNVSKVESESSGSGYFTTYDSSASSCTESSEEMSTGGNNYGNAYNNNYYGSNDDHTIMDDGESSNEILDTEEESAARRARSNIASDVSELSQFSFIVDQTAKSLRKDVESVQVRKNVIANEIQQYFNLLRQSLNEREGSLIKELSELSETQKGVYLAAEVDLQRTAKYMRKTATDLSNLPNNLSYQEVLNKSEYVHKNVKALMNSGMSLIRATDDVHSLQSSAVFISDKNIIKRIRHAGSVEERQPKSSSSKNKNNPGNKTRKSEPTSRSLYTITGKQMTKRGGIGFKRDIPFAAEVLIPNSSSYNMGDEDSKISSIDSSYVNKARVFITDPTTGREREFIVGEDNSVTEL